MRNIEFEQIAEAVADAAVEACYELPVDVFEALQKARDNESSPTGRDILDQLMENARIAGRQRIPLCQDTGVAVVFVEQGVETVLKQDQADEPWTLEDAVNAGVTEGYERGYLRKSIVAEPLNKRKNTNTNAPAVIHHRVVPGDKLKITLMAKGGGCENKSQLKMFNPTAESQQVASWVVDVVRQAGADACPPFVVGVGLGGDFELSCILAKKALLRNLAQRHSDYFYARLEQYIMEQINATGIGPQGLGGDTTALAVNIETAPCHIASLPAAVNIECHSHRHKTVVI